VGTRAGLDAHEGIKRPDVPGLQATGDKLLQGLAQVRDAAVVDQLRLGQRQVGIGE